MVCRLNDDIVLVEAIREEYMVFTRRVRAAVWQPHARKEKRRLSPERAIAYIQAIAF